MQTSGPLCLYVVQTSGLLCLYVVQTSGLLCLYVVQTSGPLCLYVVQTSGPLCLYVVQTSGLRSLLSLRHGRGIDGGRMLHYALVICNHSPPRPGGGRGIAVEMSGALTKVLPRQCGGNTRGLLYIGKKGSEIVAKR